MKILIVDDAPDILTWLSALLVKAGWEVIEAADGIGACEYLESMDIRIVITDWMMPGMDGLSLIEWIRARNEHRYIYTILMTSRNEQRDCVQGLSVGADDYLTKPVASTILHARLSVAQRILQMQEELLTQQSRLRESRDLVTRTYARVREDIKNAAVVQKSRLPYNGLAARSISTAWCYRPAMGVSGDHLDIFQVGDKRVVFFLLDVSGHGVSAALRSSAISQLLRPISGMMDGLTEHGPGHVLQRLNRQICDGNQDLDFFATLVMGDLDAATGLLRLASAGHPPPLLLRQAFGAVEINFGELPLGIDDSICYSNQEIMLQPGDSLVLFSDGLLDCEDSGGQRYGMNQFRNRLENHRQRKLPGLLEKIEEDFDDWRAGAPLADDLSVLLLRFNPEHLDTEINEAKKYHVG
jgi:sigma-B regulation protein RsbU (phosphoserine phosphatase)